MEKENLAKEIDFLAKRALPRLAKERQWPVHLDHCFKRILFDNVLGCKWSEKVKAPFCNNATADQMQKVVELGYDVINGVECLRELNQHSLHWRGKQYGRSQALLPA